MNERTQQLEAVLVAAKRALETCRVGMQALTGKGVRSQPFSASADQFSAAWRDLKAAVDAVED